MAMYRKKPVVVEAWQWTPPNLSVMPDWLGAAIDADKAMVHDGPPQVITIATMEGTMTASPGDWIIQGVKGEIYPCKPDVFAATYDPAALERPPEVEANAMRHDPEWRAQPTVAGLIAEDDYHHPNQRATRFRYEMQQVINSHSRENGSDTPDFILAEFMLEVFDAFDKAVTKRTGWYGKARTAELQQQLCAQLQAEGEHTAAGQAEIERLNAENAQLRGELQRVSMAGLTPSMVVGK